MLDEVDYRLSEVLDAFGNAIRLKLIMMLHDEPRSVSECAEELEKPIPTTSRHLKILRDKELLKAESEQKRRIYEPKRPELIEQILRLKSYISRDDQIGDQ